MVRDPVCGMECDPRTSDKVEHQGQTYYFCNPECKSAFDKDPDRYVKAQQRGEYLGMPRREQRGGYH